METETLEAVVELPKEFRDKWLEALRSGNYIQGQDLLLNPRDGTMCCLGVACKVLGIPSTLIEDECMPNDLNAIDIDIYNLPEPIISGLWCSDLADKNDKGVPFKEIADYIEQTSVGV
jgi:hypothetical protein